MRRSGCRQTIERASVTMPAARRVRLKNHQLSINFLDGILIRMQDTAQHRRLSVLYPPGIRVATDLYGLKSKSLVRYQGWRVGDWEVVLLLESACEGKMVSAGERCLGHQEGGLKERVEDE
jgi:hypothetical protein